LGIDAQSTQLTVSSIRKRFGSWFIQNNIATHMARQLDQLRFDRFKDFMLKNHAEPAASHASEIQPIV
jgi:hypothetical protein